MIKEKLEAWKRPLVLKKQRVNDNIRMVRKEGNLPCAANKH